MERKSGLVWLIAPAVHSHPNDDIVLYHYNLETHAIPSTGKIAVLFGDRSPKKNLCSHGGLDPPPTQKPMLGNGTLPSNVIRQRTYPENNLMSVMSH